MSTAPFLLVDVGGQPTSCSAGASHARDYVALNIIQCDLTSEISSREREAPADPFWAASYRPQATMFKAVIRRIP